MTLNGNIYDTENSVQLCDLLQKPTIIELNAIDNQEQEALLMALLLINIILYTKHNQAGDGNLKNILLIDEAHVLLGGGTQRFRQLLYCVCIRYIRKAALETPAILSHSETERVLNRAMHPDAP